ncbi:MAG: hypothetical protein ACTSRI_14885, partial [Promethearchaeota archaeon]
MTFNSLNQNDEGNMYYIVNEYPPKNLKLEIKTQSWVYLSKIREKMINFFRKLLISISKKSFNKHKYFLNATIDSELVDFLEFEEVEIESYKEDALVKTEDKLFYKESNHILQENVINRQVEDLVIDKLESINQNNPEGEKTKVPLEEFLVSNVRKPRRSISPSIKKANESQIESNLNQRNKWIKNKPKVLFDLSKGRIFLQMPIIKFQNYTEFENSDNIKVSLKILGFKDEITEFKINLEEKNIRIKKFEAEPKLVSLDIFKSYDCRLSMDFYKFKTHYQYEHNDLNCFIFIEKKNYNELVYNTKKFFKDGTSFWILIKDEYHLSANPIVISEMNNYPNYKLINIKLDSDVSEIIIYDENGNNVINIYKEPSIILSPKQDGFIFDKFYNLEPL